VSSRSGDTVDVTLPRRAQKERRPFGSVTAMARRLGVPAAPIASSGPANNLDGMARVSSHVCPKFADSRLVLSTIDLPRPQVGGGSFETFLYLGDGATNYRISRIRTSRCSARIWPQGADLCTGSNLRAARSRAECRQKPARRNYRGGEGNSRCHPSSASHELTRPLPDTFAARASRAAKRLRYRREA